MIRNDGLPDVRPLLAAETIARLRTDIGARPVGARRRGHRRIGRVLCNTAEAIIDADLDDMDRFFDLWIDPERSGDRACVAVPLSVGVVVSRWM